MLEILPSIASASQMNLAKTVSELEQSGFRHLHIDIEDGNFIPNITFGLKTVRELSEITDMKFSMHLMVTDPLQYIPELRAVRNVQSVIVNIDGLPYVSRILYEIKKRPDLLAGIAFNPATPTDAIRYYSDRIDLVMQMTAEPDGRGQRYIAGMTGKIREIRKAYPTGLQIIADGGVTADRLKELEEAGADKVVLGRELFQNGGVAENMKRLQNRNG